MKKLTTLFLFFLLFGCSASKIPFVQQTYDSSTDISKLKTYAWVAQKSISKIDPHYQQILKKSILNHLEKKGYIQIPNQPDFTVSAYINLEKKTYTIDDASNLKRTVQTIDKQPIHVKIEEGGIIISFLEKATQKYFFQGIAKAQVDRTLSPKKIEQQIHLATEELLKEFPESKYH